MTYALVKINCDLYAPGAVLSPQLAKWVNRIGELPTRRALYPVVPLSELYDTIVLQDFAHIRVSSMDHEYYGVFDSELDFVLSNVPLDVFLGSKLARIAADATLTSPPYRQQRTHASWLELWEFNEENFIGSRAASFSQIVETIKTKTP